MSLEPSPFLASATQIVAAHLGNNIVALSDVPVFIKKVYETLAGLEGVPGENYDVDARDDSPKPKPAVPVSESVQHDFIVCLEDGKRLRMLKRYLMAQYKMTPQDYRSKWGLSPDYPMVAPAVAEQRRESARAIGLGRPARAKGARRARR